MATPTPGSGRPRIRIPAAVTARALSPRWLWVLIVILLLIIWWNPVINPFLTGLTAPWRNTTTTVVSNDADSDGILDSVDTCPNQSGVMANNGCPAQAGGQTPTPGAGGGAQGNTILVNGVPVGVLNPQTQIGHPAFYLETGVSGSQTWTVSVPAGAVMIAGGFSVDGQSNGTYKAWTENQTITTTVQNGFVLVTMADWGSREFCFRVQQAASYNWAHSNVLPLSNWPACSTEAATVVQPTPGTVSTTVRGDGRLRQETGVGRALNFVSGDTVWGFQIRLNNGTTYNQCVLEAPSAGTLTDGVINPSPREVEGVRRCQ